MNCASFEQLFAWAQNQLPAAEAERICIHLDAECKACQQGLDQAQEILAAAESCELIQPPDWLIDQTMSLIIQQMIECDEDPVERIPAFLLVDSFAQATSAGIRSARPMSRQLLYRAGNYDINLSLNYVNQTQEIDIIGRALPLSADPVAVSEAEVELLTESTVVCATEINQFGMFILRNIQQGKYDLRITLNDEEIDIVGLNVVVRSRRRNTIH